MPDNKEKFIKKLNILNELVVKEDFLSAFKFLTDFVKKAVEVLNQRFNQTIAKTETQVMEMKSDMDKEKEKMMADCAKDMEKMEKAHSQMMMKMDRKMEEIRPPEMPDEEIIAEKASKIAISEVLPKIPTIEQLGDELPKLWPQVRNALEIPTVEEDKLEIDAIGYLKERLEKIEEELKSKQRVLGGGGGLSAIALQQHFINDETPTGNVNGVNTVFILNHTPSPTTSLKLFLDGQRMKLTTDYTLSNKTITFLSAPLTNSIITVDYMI